jgi:hypothetical protein
MNLAAFAGPPLGRLRAVYEAMPFVRLDAVPPCARTTLYQEGAMSSGDPFDNREIRMKTTGRFLA